MIVVGAYYVSNVNFAPNSNKWKWGYGESSGTHTTFHKINDQRTDGYIERIFHSKCHKIPG